MKALLLIGTLATLVPQAAAQEEAPMDTTYGGPLIVLTITNPWAMVLGSDVPTFALYETGRIIYTKVVDEHRSFMQVQLSDTELDAFMAKLNLTDDLFKLPTEIEASDWTDQPSNDLFIQGDSMKFVSVYGNLKDEKEARRKAPKSFLKVFDQLVAYASDKATEWLPERIEVMAWDYDYAPNSRPWPEGWPDLRSPDTVERENGMYSIYLPKEQLPALREFMQAEGEKEAVVINGKKMTLSVRYPFPNW